MRSAFLYAIVVDQLSSSQNQATSLRYVKWNVTTGKTNIKGIVNSVEQVVVTPLFRARMPLPPSIQRYSNLVYSVVQVLRMQVAVHLRVP